MKGLTVRSGGPVAERAVILAVALGVMLVPLNSTMIAVSLPRIMAEFGVGIAQAGWLVTAYLIFMASLQPIAGKLGDALGRRRLILGGLVYFGLASFFAAASPDLGWLLFSRVNQAIAGAVLVPNGVALVREVVPTGRRAGSFGLIGTAATLAAAAGPPLGGLLDGAMGWRAIFYVNLPLVLMVLLLGFWTIPVGRTRLPRLSFDLTGALLLFTVLAGTAWLLSVGYKLGVPLALPMGSALLIATAFFVSRELRHPDPVFQPRFFGSRTFAASNAAMSLSNLAVYAVLLVVPILLLGRVGWTSSKVGLVLAGMLGSSILFIPLGGRLADRLGRRWPTVAGLTLLTLGLLPLALGGGEIELSILLSGLCAAGVGLGLSSAGLQTAAVESVAPKEAGVASGIFSTSRYLGSIVGSSLLAGMLGPAPGDGGFSAIFLMIFLAAALSAVASLGLRDWPTAGPHLSGSEGLRGY
jgi:EmrB/QacA subfamily drug resistance transporter